MNLKITSLIQKKTPHITHIIRPLIVRANAEALSTNINSLTTAAAH